MDNARKEFSKIYDSNIERIYRYVFLRVNSEEIAQDLTSDTFIKAWEVFRKDKNKIKNPSAFLYRVAKNLVVDHYRKKGRVVVVSIDDSLNQLPASGANPEELAIASSDLAPIQKAISGLHEDYQNAIIWRYLDDLSINEIASLLDRSEEATRVLIHRAMKALKANLS